MAGTDGNGAGRFLRIEDKLDRLGDSLSEFRVETGSRLTHLETQADAAAKAADVARDVGAGVAEATATFREETDSRLTHIEAQADAAAKIAVVARDVAKDAADAAAKTADTARDVAKDAADLAAKGRSFLWYRLGILLSFAVGSAALVLRLCGVG